MIKSRFSFKTYLYVAMIIPTFFLPIYLFINRVETFGENYNLKFLFVSLIMLFTCFWFILGTIKRVLWIEINSQEIRITNILFSKTKIKISTFDGFETSIETSNAGNYEVMYLIKNKKSLVHISEFHLANYKELKSSIETKMSNLGYVPSRFFSDWKRYW
jgi:hypothetical protein